MKVYLETWEQTLKAPHAFPDRVRLIERREFDLDDNNILGLDYWYRKVPTFPMIEKELRRIGAMTYLPAGHAYWFGIVK